MCIKMAIHHGPLVLWLPAGCTLDSLLLYVVFFHSTLNPGYFPLSEEKNKWLILSILVFFIPFKNCFHRRNRKGTKSFQLLEKNSKLL